MDCSELGVWNGHRESPDSWIPDIAELMSDLAFGASTDKGVQQTEINRKKNLIGTIRK